MIMHQGFCITDPVARAVQRRSSITSCDNAPAHHPGPIIVVATVSGSQPSLAVLHAKQHPPDVVRAIRVLHSDVPCAGAESKREGT